MKRKEIERLAEKISINRAAIDHERILTDAEAALEASKRPEMSHVPVLLRSRFKLVVCAGSLAAALLIISSLVACFVLSGKVSDLKNELELAQRDVAVAQPDDTATINFYLEEHRDFVARHASASPATPQPAQMRVNKHDILYYESFDDGPEYVSPGIIVRGPSSQLQTGSPEAPVISNGHTLSLSEAIENTDFDLAAPPWLHPYYKHDQIRTIEDRDALQLLYTNGTNTISLFEQPLDGRRGLESKDFREYAVYRNEGQVGGIILAWRDDVLSYVLIGNTEMSQLMDMAQSISAGK